ncbi:iron-containing alcohol dehydrogenase [Fonticella tunisiensis]|uniref:Alcohol dehydrogenase class IV n=1 Tax=Fonticella tunisiensis TaxID=1096341 RepID=A0A4R7K987_9CLOT|nr:iron-containing alcohol dehydrogenase [Fonticella tunisiensis]TDT50577.1 hypothetical protein EDD71_12742 [Fonticella tunisiensis]
MKFLRFHGDAIVTGKNSIEYLKELDFKKAFIVTGGKSMFENGTIGRIKSILEEKGCCVHVYSGITKNPTTDAVLDGLEVMRKFSPDVVIGVGGGSPIDAAKIMSLFYEYPELNFDNALERPLPRERKKLKFIAIPSTSGTATEVTRAAVVTYVDRNIKKGLKTEAFVPDIAILDSTITLSMPKNVVAETGMDAMTHAVECYINKNIDDFAEVLAAGAVEGLYRYLPLSYKYGDEVSREKVHNYQCIAGCAFSNVGLGMAHGISHSIGGRYNYGHGLINAVVLPYVLQYNSRDNEVKDRLAYLAKRIGRDDFIKAIKDLNRELNIPLSFREMGISSEDFDRDFSLLVENSLSGSTRVNPVKASREDMIMVLKNIYDGKDIDF